MSFALTIDAVEKFYGRNHALKGVSFDIREGEFFGLLGPNGAGKSTLINAMAGLVIPSAGRIQVMGHDVIRDYRQARQALGVVPQELVYDPFFSVRELLQLQSGYFGLRRNDDWIDEMLQILDLSHKADANMHDLSGGMKRRVLIAQAMVHKPQVLVLDEPTAGVDVDLRQQLWNFTCKLHQEGHTIILTTHYLEEAEALCDRIAIINHGELVALDSKQALLNRCPDRILTLIVDDASPPLPAEIESLVLERDAQRIKLRINRDAMNTGEVLAALHRQGMELIDLHIEEPGLEEVFMELTRRPLP